MNKYYLLIILTIISILIIHYRYSLIELFIDKNSNCDSIKDENLKNECNIKKSCYKDCDYINQSEDTEENKLQILNNCVEKCIINKNKITGKCLDSLDLFRRKMTTVDEFCKSIGPKNLKCNNLQLIQEEANVKCLSF